VQAGGIDFGVHQRAWGPCGANPPCPA
jgi:hypothetical protein